MEWKQAYDRVYWRGELFNYRTVAMLVEAEDDSGIIIDPIQGSYQGSSSAAASGTTHDGGGAVDISVSHLSLKRKHKLLAALKRVGFAVWWRRDRPGVWDEHFHAEAIGDDDLTQDARLQVNNYKSRGNGLWPLITGDDPDPWRPDPIPVFNYREWLREANLTRRLKRITNDIRRLVRNRKRIRRKRDKLRNHHDRR